MEKMNMIAGLGFIGLLLVFPGNPQGAELYLYDDFQDDQIDTLKWRQDKTDSVVEGVEETGGVLYFDSSAGGNDASTHIEFASTPESIEADVKLISVGSGNDDYGGLGLYCVWFYDPTVNEPNTEKSVVGIVNCFYNKSKPNPTIKFEVRTWQPESGEPQEYMEPVSQDCQFGASYKIKIVKGPRKISFFINDELKAQTSLPSYVVDIDYSEYGEQLPCDYPGIFHKKVFFFETWSDNVVKASVDNVYIDRPLPDVCCESDCGGTGVTFSVPEGALHHREKLDYPYSPSCFEAVTGFAVAATLESDQSGSTAEIFVDYWRLIEENVIEETETILFEENYDNPKSPPALECTQNNCEGGLYVRVPTWFATDEHSQIEDSEIKDGYLHLDLAPNPDKLFHWWTDRFENKPGCKYYVEGRFKVVGDAALRFGADWWTDMSAEPDGSYMACEGNNCKAWNSDWIGDTNGQFIVFRGPRRDHDDDGSPDCLSNFICVGGCMDNCDSCVDNCTDGVAHVSPTAYKNYMIVRDSVVSDGSMEIPGDFSVEIKSGKWLLGP